VNERLEIYLQGDVVVAPAKLPRNATSNGNEVRIASESGNPHVLKGRAFNAQGQQYVVLDEPTPLTHPQHPTKVIPAGTYEVRTVRDYIPRRFLD